jgi:hypothetical protein
MCHGPKWPMYLLTTVFKAKECRKCPQRNPKERSRNMEHGENALEWAAEVWLQCLTNRCRVYYMAIYYTICHSFLFSNCWVCPVCAIWNIVQLWNVKVAVKWIHLHNFFLSNVDFAHYPTCNMLQFVKGEGTIWARVMMSALITLCFYLEGLS